MSIEQYKQRVDELVKVIEEKEVLITEFDDKIFNALVDRIDILELTHFVIKLKNQIKIEENIM